MATLTLAETLPFIFDGKTDLFHLDPLTVKVRFNFVLATAHFQSEDSNIEKVAFDLGYTLED